MTVDTEHLEVKLQSTLSLTSVVVELGHPLRVPSDSCERAVVILGGKCDVEVPGFDRAWRGLGRRKNVFEGTASAAYIPRGAECHISACGGVVSLAIISVEACVGGEPYVIPPEDVDVERRGNGSWEREVHNIVRPTHYSNHLLVGETFSRSGGVWSGFPPHKHDMDDFPHERRFAERFLVHVRPETGFGVLVNYLESPSDGMAQVVSDGAIVSVDNGFHSFVAAGGHDFYYLWALAGEVRELTPRTDPRFDWLRNSLNVRPLNE